MSSAAVPCLEMLILSYADAHAARDLIYSWKQNPGVKILDDTMSQFELTGYDSKSEMVGYVAGELMNLNFSLFNEALLFHIRILLHFLIQVEFSDSIGFFLPKYVIIKKKLKDLFKLHRKVACSTFFACNCLQLESVFFYLLAIK